MISRSGLGPITRAAVRQTLHFAADIRHGSVLLVSGGGGQKHIRELRSFRQETNPEQR